MSDDLHEIKEAIKLRSPIEEIVRERVSGLRRAGALWTACCPFHAEKTPSFKVDPRRGTWHCYGACGKGGDVISFVELSYNVDYIEALEILGARAGIALPERRDSRRGDESEPRFELMARTEEFYRRALRRPDGATALAYIRGRGLTDTTIDAFGIGFAPPSGTELVAKARSQGVAVERLVELGLARVDDSGRAYDFFRGRVLFPVRDLKGRTVGFGARRLSDEDKRAPKYINTPETPLFHKGRMFFALDHALAHVRRCGHLIVVEGYTDVMAAHQVGLRQTVAVLGTATTDDHAALVRRTGARRISLLFDGDEAGRKATVRGLDGLLKLEVQIDVVRLPGDEDPCDLLVREGAAPLERLLGQATPWFDFLVQWMRGLHGDERYRAIDEVLALLGKLAKPVERDDRIADLARALELPVEGVRAQFESLPERRRAAERARREAEAPAAANPAGAIPASRPANPQRARIERRLSESLRGIVGAALVDPALAAHAGPYRELCGDRDLRRLLEVLAELHARTLGTFAIADVFDALGDDPARALVSGLVADASAADGIRAWFDDNARAFAQAYESIHHHEQLALLRAGVVVDPQDLRALEEMRRARFVGGAPASQGANSHDPDPAAPSGGGDVESASSSGL